MTDKKIKLDRMINDFKNVGFSEVMASTDALGKLIDIEKMGLCDGGCIALSPLPPCSGCCISSSPGIVNFDDIIDPVPIKK